MTTSSPTRRRQLRRVAMFVRSWVVSGVSTAGAVLRLSNGCGIRCATRMPIVSREAQAD
jgi:hypothetical protein